MMERSEPGIGDIIRNDWLEEHQTIHTWDEVRQRKSSSDQYSEEQFWRGQESSAHQGLTDEQLFSNSLLIEIPRKGVFHAAYVPWKFPDGTPGKASWSDAEWENLKRRLSQFVKGNPIHPREFSWRGLTLPSSIAGLFSQSIIEDSYFYGSLSGTDMEFAKLRNLLIDGDAEQLPSTIREFHITGTARFLNRSVEIFNSRLNKLILTGRKENNKRNDIRIERSKISEVRLSTDFNAIDIRDTSIASFSIFDAEINRIDMRSKTLLDIGLSFKGTVRNRATFRNLNLINPSSSEGRGFSDSKFLDKLDIIDCDFRLSDLSDTDLKGPIEIRPKGQTIEKVFDQEWNELAKESNGFAAEDARRELERACQIICDRHKQDGRKDLEHRFRRLEVKARSSRSDADNATKLVNWFYRTTSDFGLSLLRPISSWIATIVLFFFIYLMFVALYTGRIRIGLPDYNFIHSIALFTVDKAFPLGISVDETRLLGGKLVGHEAGWSAFVLGVLGTLQTLLSGIFFFLIGLAVRTRLLIG